MNRRIVNLPMNNVGEEVIMLQPVVGIYSLVVDGEGTSSDAPLVLSCRVRSELSREHVEYLLSDPSAFRERGECEVVGVYFPEACKREWYLEI